MGRNLSFKQYKMTTKEWNDIFPLIPTAEELLTKGWRNLVSREEALKAMIEFAKLHVEAALKANDCGELGLIKYSLNNII